MLLLLILCLSIAAVPLAAGNLRALGGLRFRYTWLLVVALAFQVVLYASEGPPTPLRVAAHLISYPLGVAFLLLNRRIPGLWLIAVGASVNFVAIAVNGGTMPAAPHALALAGLPLDAGSLYSNSTALAHPHLLILGDVFAVPAGWPFANVFSIGDLCVVSGAIVAIHRVSGSRLIPSGAGQFRALVVRGPFMRLWSAQVVSNLGDWIYWLAVSTTLSERVHGPAFASALAILLVVQFVPSAICGAFLAGPIVDRHSRRVLMVASDVIRAVAVGSLLLNPDAEPMHFYVVAAVLGLCGAIFQPSLLASIPNVVDEEQIVPAQAMVGATLHLAIMVGPAIGGYLVSVVAPTTAVGLNAVSFGLSAILIGGVAIPRRADRGAPTASVWRSLVAGLSYIASNRLIRGLILVVGVVFLAAATKAPLEPLFVRDVLARGGAVADRARVFGIITTAWGLGMLLGSAAAPAAARRWARERLFPLAIAFVGCAIIVVSRTNDFSTVLLAWLLAGAANSIGNVSYESLLQERTPDAMRGRVFAATEAVSDVSFLIGAIGAGLLGTALPVTDVFAIAGGIMLLAAAIGVLVVPAPRSAVRDRPVESQPGGMPHESRPVTRKPASRTS